MKIAYNPTTATALTAAPSNNDITFDLKGLSIFVRGTKFKGTDTTYNVFKRHTSASGGGYNGLVPVPSYSTTNTRFLREDGSWDIPISKASLYTYLTKEDLDTLKDEGRWYYAGGENTTTNRPSGVGAYELYVGRNANVYRYQKLITSDGLIWFRYHNSSAWTTWVRWYTDMNTDQKVLQSASTTSNYRPLALGYTNSSTTAGLNTSATQQVYVTTTIYAQPSTGSLWANKLYSGGNLVLTEHQSLANYVTLNTVQSIIANKTFKAGVTINTNSTEDNALIIQRYHIGEAVKHWVDDAVYHVTYNNDELACGIDFTLNNTGTENNNTDQANTSQVYFRGSSVGSEVRATYFLGNLKGSINTSTTAVTQEATDISTKVATTAFVKTAINNLINGAPDTLDTLKEISDFLQDGTVVGGLLDQLSKKVNKAGDIMTGALSFSGPAPFTWLGGTYQQKLLISDNSTSGDAVFTFQQSTNSGASWNDLFTICDDGSVISKLGYKILNLTDNSVLLAGGGHINLSQSTATPNIQGQVTQSFKRGAFTKVNQYFGNGNIVSIDPVPTDSTVLSAHTTILSLGDSATRNTQLAFLYEKDVIRYRRCVNTTWSNWVTLLHSGNYSSFLNNTYYTKSESDDRFVNVSGDTMTGLLTAHTGSNHSGIKLGSVYLSAVSDQVIYQNLKALRFGNTDSWTYDHWAGLKYDTVNKTIHLGLPDGTIFNHNGTASTNGILNLPGIATLNLSGSIKNLAVGGGIYWNPYVESATDSSDAASITVVKNGPSTTLQISQWNDAEDCVNVLTKSQTGLKHNGITVLDESMGVMYGKIFKQHNQGIYTKLLSFEYTYSTQTPSVSFTWHPIEVYKMPWADFQIYIRKLTNTIEFTRFFVNWKNNYRYDVYAEVTDTKCTIWAKTPDINLYNPYGVLQITNYSNITNLIYCPNEYSDTISPEAIQPTLTGIASMLDNYQANTLLEKVEWANGTTAGPTLAVGVGGRTLSAVIPSASVSASGIVTTGVQWFGGVKIFKPEEGALAIYNHSPSTFGAETVCLQTSIDGQDPRTCGQCSLYPNRHILALQPRGGYVGINTLTPTYPLHINGKIKVQGEILGQNYEMLQNGSTLDLALKNDNWDNTAGWVFADTYFSPYTVYNNKISLGRTNARWNNIYSALGNFSNNITALGYVKTNSSDSYILLGGGGHKAVSDFMLKSEELSSNVTIIEKTLTVTQEWMDTGITGLSQGTYIIQVYAHSSNNNLWYSLSSGIMSWHSDATNDTEGDEIILHRAAHAYSNVIYLRTLTTRMDDTTNTDRLYLQISANKDLVESTYTFKFKRVL